jgi:hypothetical protein
VVACLVWWLHDVYFEGNKLFLRLYLLPSAGLLNRLQWMENAYPHVNEDVGCFKTAIGFVDHLTEALGPLLIGVPLVIPSPDILKENLLSLIKFIEVSRSCICVLLSSLDIIINF